MKKITTISGTCVALDMHDVDTDLIIPAQFLTTTSRTGFGEHLFQRLKASDPNFVFNQQKYKGAKILIAGVNFGCGSSREHAVWALQQAGIQAIIAVSFADIFSNNAAKNGLVLIQQPAESVKKLLQQAKGNILNLKIDLTQDKILLDDDTYCFKLNDFHKHCFINGLDELDYILAHMEQIKEFKTQQNM